MKIIKIVFENLNSLLGKHEIDFAQEFGSQGIFAIVGPTGAGKTTILDAICLALYGQTPRLDNLAKSENEIMSRQTSGCSAEVIFATNKNEQFLCRWEQRRARNRSDGNLQAAEHTISEPADEKGKWNILSSKGKDVKKLVEEKTGMSFDNFTRSILLAQGNFAKFLQSNMDERASILEQITGTDIYTKISMRVHERHREVKDKLNNLKEQLGNVEIIDAETINRIQSEVAELEKNVKEHQNKADFITNGLQYQKSIEQYECELQRNEELLHKLINDESAFQSDAAKLSMARKARDIESIFGNLIRYRNEHDHAGSEKDTLEKDLPTREQKLEAAQKEEIKADASYKDVIKFRDIERETIRKVREIDRELNEFDVNLQNVNRRCHELYETKTKYETNLNELKENLSATLEGESFDALQMKYNGVKSELTALTKGKELSDWREEKETASENVRCWDNILTAFKNCIELRTNISYYETKITVSEKEFAEIGLALPNLEQEKEDKDKIVELIEKRRDDLRTITSLEEHRKQLEDGKPCPCCGSTNHPYAEGNLPKENLMETELKDAKQKQNDVAENISNAKNKKTELEINLRQMKEKHEDLNNQIIQENQKIDNAPHFVSDENSIQTAMTAAKSENEQIGKLISDIETLQKRERELDKRISSVQVAQTKIKLETDQVQQAEKDLKTQGIELTELEKKRQIKQNKRIELFDEKKPEEYEQKLDADVESVLKALDIKRKIKIEAEKERDQIKQKLDIVTKISSEKKTLIELTMAEFEEQYHQAGFESEEQFTAARIEPNRLHQLEEREKELQTQRKMLAVLCNEKKENLKQTKTELAEHWASELSGAEYSLQNEEELKITNQILNDEIGYYNQAIGSRKEKIIDNEKRETESQNKRKEIEKMEQESRLWGTLHELIGSSDGKKYKIFVQSLTFRYLIEHANRQLKKMSERYLLVPKEEEQGKEDKSQLVLNIVDKYQSGMERSTKNLSGGESFLVSLALALGLSAMSSQKVRVDSLFLDEGFGTLDEETLETALNVLDGLRHEGKQIGIISHVPLIRERIPLQIRVIPEGGGRSNIKIGSRYAD